MIPQTKGTQAVVETNGSVPLFFSWAVFLNHTERMSKCTDGMKAEASARRAEHHRRLWRRKVMRQPSELGSFPPELCEEEKMTMTN